MITGSRVFRKRAGAEAVPGMAQEADGVVGAAEVEDSVDLAEDRSEEAEQVESGRRKFKVR